MKRKRGLIAAILIVAVALTGGSIVLVRLFAADSEPPPVRIESVANLKTAQKQLVSGAVHTAESENFYVDQTKGRVSQIKVAQGTRVRKDEELYAYSNPTLTVAHEKAMIQVDTAIAKERGLQTKLANLNAEIRKAPSSQALEQLKIQRTELRAEAEAAQTEIKVARLDADETKNEVAALTVRANFDGVVEMVNEDERNAIAQGAATKPLVRVVSNLPYEIKGKLSELQRVRIKEGQRFTATSKALPGKRWNGSIVYVSTFPAEQSGSQGMPEPSSVQYEFTAKLEGQENLIPGTTLFLEITTTGNDSFNVPVAAVRKDSSESYIFVAENGLARKRVVSTGPDADGQIAITAPMDDRTEILLNPGSDIRDGAELRR